MSHSSHVEYYGAEVLMRHVTIPTYVDLFGMEVMSLVTIVDFAGSITLHTISTASFDSDENPDYDVPLYIKGYGELDSGDGDFDVTLYIRGLDTFDDGDGGNTIPLYLKGGVVLDSDDNADWDVPLYIFGLGVFDEDEGDNSITLFLKVPEPYPTSEDDEPFNLYIKGYGGTETKTTTLYVGGSVNPEMVGGIPLHILGEFFGEFPLYIGGWQDPIQKTAIFPLFLLNNPDNALGSIPLYLSNTVENYTDDVTLYIGGFGVTDGAVPYNTNMPLFIARDVEGVSSVFSLFLANNTVEDGVTFYIDGVYTFNSSINLYMPVEDTKINTLKLYTHGF